MTKILLVEDEERIRSLLKEVLESEGYEVQEASSGKEALQSYARSPPDLINTHSSWFTKWSCNTPTAASVSPGT